MSDTCITPVGRFVSGSITEKRTTDYEGRTLPDDKQHFAFGVAFPKTDPAMPAVFGYLQAAARAGHAGLPAVEAFDLNGYSWKIKDGDVPNGRGETNANTAGCYVFYFSPMYPVNCCDQTNATLPTDAVYRGCYVDMVIAAKSNGLRGDKAGIYLNPNWMRFIANGEKITGGVDAKTAFGGHTPAALPPGASASPVPSSAPSAAMTAPAPARDFVQNATGAAPATQTMPGLPGMPS
jgi:hypothetical protein